MTCERHFPILTATREQKWPFGHSAFIISYSEEGERVNSTNSNNNNNNTGSNEYLLSAEHLSFKPAVILGGRQTYHPRLLETEMKTQRASASCPRSNGQWVAQMGCLTRSLRPELNFISIKVKYLIRNMRPKVSYKQDLKMWDIKILKIHL